ncbi:MAG TPA: hypothetical protein VFC45_02890 [Pseudolabrys sp.]|nr:hypothetical protein [Pseudolabrys sp.]
MMNRKACLLAAAILMIAWIVSSTSSHAERALGDSGYCPAGTCSGQGGKWAQHTKYCSAKNCKIIK